MDFKDKVVLVTGSSKGIGRQVALDLSKEGANVIINYNSSKEKALLLENEIKEKYNTSPFLIKCNISKEDEVKNMIDAVKKKYNRIDILINNAGICNDTLFNEKTYDDFRKVLEVNLIGTYLVTKHVGEMMLKNKGGKIINIASDNGLDNGYPESCEYDASKAGVISLTHNMAKYYAPYINVNCVCPGWTNTDMNKELDDLQRRDISQGILLKRFAEAEEISNVVLFLASDKASYVNDEIIKVNGGTL